MKFEYFDDSVNAWISSASTSKSYNFGDETSNNIDNYILIKYANGKKYNLTLPCYPDEIADTVAANWSEQTVIGRSSPVAGYIGATFRNTQFSTLLHREMSNNPDDIEKLLANLRRAVYPAYRGSGYIPATITVRIGEYKAHGFLRNISYNWQKPIIDDKYQTCNLSLSIDELLPDGFNGGSSSYLNSSLSPYSR